MSDVRAECKARFGDKPCITNVLDAKGNVIGTEDCADWCPLLRRPIEDPPGKVTGRAGRLDAGILDGPEGADDDPCKDASPHPYPTLEEQ